MEESNQKHSGFEAPVYGRMVQDDEELIKMPNGNFKLVKKYSLEKHYFEMSRFNYERPAQIPILRSRLNYLLNEYSPQESDRWIMFKHPNHFLIYDIKTKFCIYDAEYEAFEEQYEDPEPICAVVTKLRINQDSNQHPEDIDNDFGVVADLLVKEL